MKENYQIYLPYQFHRRPHSVDWDPQLANKKIKTMFLSNMSKGRRLTSTFFPIRIKIPTRYLDQAKGQRSEFMSQADRPGLFWHKTHAYCRYLRPGLSDCIGYWYWVYNIHVHWVFPIYKTNFVLFPIQYNTIQYNKENDRGKNNIWEKEWMRGRGGGRAKNQRENWKCGEGER